MGRKGTAHPESITQPSLDEEKCPENFSQDSGIESSLDEDFDALLLCKERHAQQMSFIIELTALQLG